MTLKELNDTIGGRIRQRRRILGKTLAELGRQIGVSAAAISLWENGTTSPEAKRLEALCQYLYCTMEWLVDGKESLSTDFSPQEETNDLSNFAQQSSHRPMPELEEIDSIFVVLPSRQRKQLIDYAYQLLDGYHKELSEKINLVKSINKTKK